MQRTLDPTAPEFVPSSLVASSTQQHNAHQTAPMSVDAPTAASTAATPKPTFHFDAAAPAFIPSRVVIFPQAPTFINTGGFVPAIPSQAPILIPLDQHPAATLPAPSTASSSEQPPAVIYTPPPVPSAKPQDASSTPVSVAPPQPSAVKCEVPAPAPAVSAAAEPTAAPPSKPATGANSSSPTQRTKSGSHKSGLNARASHTHTHTHTHTAAATTAAPAKGSDLAAPTAVAKGIEVAAPAAVSVASAAEVVKVSPKPEESSVSPQATPAPAQAPAPAPAPTSTATASPAPEASTPKQVASVELPRAATSWAMKARMAKNIPAEVPLPKPVQRPPVVAKPLPSVNATTAAPKSPAAASRKEKPNNNNRPRTAVGPAAAPRPGNKRGAAGHRKRNSVDYTATQQAKVESAPTQSPAASKITEAPAPPTSPSKVPRTAGVWSKGKHHKNGGDKAVDEPSKVSASASAPPPPPPPPLNQDPPVEASVSSASAAVIASASSAAGKDVHVSAAPPVKAVTEIASASRVEKQESLLATASASASPSPTPTVSVSEMPKSPAPIPVEASGVATDTCSSVGKEIALTETVEPKASPAIPTQDEQSAADTMTAVSATTPSKVSTQPIAPSQSSSTSLAPGLPTVGKSRFGTISGEGGRISGMLDRVKAAPTAASAVMRGLDEKIGTTPTAAGVVSTSTPMTHLEPTSSLPASSSSENGSGRIYSMEAMLSLRSLPECRDLPADHNMPVWALAGANASSIQSLMEAGRNTRGDAAKFNIPAGLMRKNFSSDLAASEATWSSNRSRNIIGGGGSNNMMSSGKGSNNPSYDRGNSGGQWGPSRSRPSQGGAITSTPTSLPEIPENSWQKQQERVKAAPAERGVKVLRQLRAQLNKMTPTTYDCILKAILEIGILSREEAEEFVVLIFDKATTNHGYVGMYADLFYDLKAELEKKGLFNSKESASTAGVGEGDVGEIEGGGKKDSEGMDFRRMILQQCQNAFQKNISNDFVPAEGSTEEEEFEQLLDYKKKMKGNLMFVGYLAQCQLVPVRVLFTILQQTLDVHQSLQLEAIASFLPTCIQALKDRPRLLLQFHQYLENVREVAHDNSVELRIRCLLTDALEDIALQFKALERQEGNNFSRQDSSNPSSSSGGPKRNFFIPPA